MNKLSLESPLTQLYNKKIPISVEKLIEAEFNSIKDILWIFPHSIHQLPQIKSLNYFKDGELFKGRGEIKNIRSTPNFWSKGKRGIVLQNITAHVQDDLSNEIIILKWFNSYPSVQKKLQSFKDIVFWGKASFYKGQMQIVSPDLIPIDEFTEENDDQELIIRYPTVNTIKSNHIKNIINKIPQPLWNEIEETLPNNILQKRKFVNLQESFKILHGISDWSAKQEKVAKERLIYEEFLEEQIKVICRRERNQKITSKKIKINDKEFQKIIDIFPFTLTTSQLNSLSDIRKNLYSEYPMMRLLQGDVGCGKTAVAISASLITINAKKQVAFMCPTETLALQHFKSISNLLENKNINIALLLGSTKAKQKKEIHNDLQKHNINLIIGTHSLIQANVKFYDLGLIIIDEQHKFGVNQRLKLIKQNEGAHSLIMTATPIPRSLRLTQYGDLDISTITQMPSGRKPIITKIISPNTIEKFLTFINTRLSMKEQVYIVVPAITESESMDIMNLEKILHKFSQLFHRYKVEGLHGQMKSDEKAHVFNEFQNGKINMLIATSVIEVGIDVHNATVMAIINPERFGLSSLHQLRGRVGRGGRPGFFFLINNKKIAPESMHRLKILEKHLDGFKIAEEDLKIRGEGDVFGLDQSGTQKPYKLANIILHSHLLNLAKDDLNELLNSNNQQTQKMINLFNKNIHVTTTI